MTHDWFIVRNGKETGPFTAQQLKQMAATRRLQPDDKVRRSDMKAATTASAIKGLFATVEVSPAKMPSPPSSETSPSPTIKIGSSKKPLIIASVAAGACLLLCCGGLGVIGILAPKKSDATKKEVADGGAPSDNSRKAQADQHQAKPAGSPQVVKFFKGGNREPLEVRVLATDEIEIVPPPLPTVNGFYVYFDIRWKKPVDKDNPSWPWRYTIFDKKGKKLGEGEVGTRDKSSKPYDAEIQSGRIVMAGVALNRSNFEDAARIDIHRGRIEPGEDDANRKGPKTEPEKQSSDTEGASAWRGGTIAEFISQMRQLSREEFPRIGWLMFDPDAGKAKSLSRNETAFFKRFGTPGQNVLDRRKIENSKATNRDKFRLWTYECKDGSVTLHVEPTTIQSTPGNWDQVLSITVEPEDCVKRAKR